MLTTLPPWPDLVLDTVDTLTGTAAEALFSPCLVGHGGPVECRAWDDVAAGPPCRTYRYALTRIWEPTRPSAVFIMLNPSTADAFQLDPTVRRCVGYAKSWGCGGLAVLNAFAYRSTDPKALRDHPDPVGRDNDLVIAKVMAAARTEPVIVAWGSDETLHRTGRGDAVVDLLRTAGVEPKCLHITSKGHPGHPLYLPASAQPIPYQPAPADMVATRKAD